MSHCSPTDFTLLKLAVSLGQVHVTDSNANNYTHHSHVASIDPVPLVHSGLPGSLLGFAPHRGPTDRWSTILRFRSPFRVCTHRQCGIFRVVVQCFFSFTGSRGLWQLIVLSHLLPLRVSPLWRSTLLLCTRVHMTMCASTATNGFVPFSPFADPQFCPPLQPRSVRWHFLLPARR